MSEIQTINPYNVRGQFRIGAVNYDAKNGHGSGDYDTLGISWSDDTVKNSRFLALMSPKTFLSLLPYTQFPSVDFLISEIKQKHALQPQCLSAADFQRNFIVNMHDGRNRAKASFEVQPNMPIPVFFQTNQETPDDFAKISAGIRDQCNTSIVRGPLFRCFFHAGKRYGVVKTPSEDGGFDYSAEEVPYSRDISAPV